MTDDRAPLGNNVPDMQKVVDWVKHGKLHHKIVDSAPKGQDRLRAAYHARCVLDRQIEDFLQLANVCLLVVHVIGAEKMETTQPPRRKTSTLERSTWQGNLI